MSASYRNLFRDLKRIGITDYDKYQNLRNTGNYHTSHDDLTEIELEFANSMQGWLGKLDAEAGTGDGLRLLIEGDCDGITKDHRKKLALYSKLSLLRAEGIDTPEWNRQQGGFGVDYQSGPDLGMCLRLAYRYKPDVVSGLLLPVPEDIAIIDRDELWDYHEKVMRGEIAVDLDRLYETDVGDHTKVSRLPEGVLSLGLQDVSDLNSVRLGVLLPSLERVPLRDVQRLRVDYEEEFQRFQKALLRFAQESEACEDPERFREIAQRVEEEVRLLEKSIDGIRRSHPKTMAAFAGSFVGLICVLAVPHISIVGAIMAALSTSLSFLMLLPPAPSSHYPIESHPLYFPLRVMEAARQK